jgi:hypothetical protein
MEEVVAVDGAGAGTTDAGAGTTDAGAGATDNKRREVPMQMFRGAMLPVSKLAQTPIAADIVLWDVDGVCHSINRTLADVCHYNALDDLWLRFAPRLHDHLDFYKSVAAIGNCSSLAPKGELQDLSE